MLGGGSEAVRAKAKKEGRRWMLFAVSGGHFISDGRDQA